MDNTQPIHEVGGQDGLAAGAQEAVLLEMPVEQKKASRAARRWAGFMFLAACVCYVMFLMSEGLRPFSVCFAILCVRPFLEWADLYIPFGHWHVFFRDAGGGVRLEKQLRFRDRVLRRRDVDLTPHTWLRVCEPDNFIVKLELGNPGYNTHVLSGIDLLSIDVNNKALRESARADLVALGQQAAALLGVEDRGFRDIC
ncbi:MAG: hypothetical protein Q4D19_13090 [Lautropia sp.]|nr:hypothetical protein [Lautropia sp.]